MRLGYIVSTGAKPTKKTPLAASAAGTADSVAPLLCSVSFSVSGMYTPASEDAGVRVAIDSLARGAPPAAPPATCTIVHVAIVRARSSNATGELRPTNGGLQARTHRLL